MMASSTMLTVVALVVVAMVAPVSADVANCSYTSPEGITYDFTPLIANNGSYTWHQTSYQTNGKYNLYTVSPDDAMTYIYELQVCGNVKSQFAACTEPSPLNRITPDGKTCVRMGTYERSQFYQNPFKDGAYWEIWGGDDVDHIHKHMARIYFQCNPNATEPRPYFEHQMTDYMSHMKFYNTISCKTTQG